MGKASKRVRDKPGRRAPTDTQRLNQVLRSRSVVSTGDRPSDNDSGDGKELKKQTFVKGRPVDDEDLPPEFPGWQSHHDGFAFFETLGWTQAPLVPEFSPTDFCAAFRARMGAPCMQFIDRSEEVPLGPNASHHVLPLALSELIAETQAFPERVALIVRTAHNTPAFLGGLWYWIVTERGSVAAARVYLGQISNQTAGMIVVRNGSFELMPTHVMMGPVRKAAGMATALVKRNPDEFLCCVCNKSFLAYEGTRAGLTHAFAGKCGHPYHIECLLDHIELFGSECHACDAMLPKNIVPDFARSELDRALLERDMRGVQI